MQRFKKYWDEWGLLVQSRAERDGGDSCARTCAFYFLLKILKPSKAKEMDSKVSSMLDVLESPAHANHYLRHPDRTSWYGNPDYGHQYFSRDQAIPLVLCMGIYKQYRKLWGFTVAWLCRLMWMTNIRRNGMYPTKELHHRFGASNKHWNFKPKLPDFAPQLLGLIIRSFYPYSLPLYPVLLITDLELLVDGSLKVLFQSKMRKMLNGDQQNHVLCLIQAQYIMPTPVSALARWIYKRFSKKLSVTLGTSSYIPSNGVQSRLQWFFREAKGDPPLDLVFKPIVEKW